MAQGMTASQRLDFANVIADMMDKTSQRTSLAKQIAAYLVAEHQTKELNSLMHDVMTARAKRGIVEADVTTARDLSSGLATQVQQLIKKEYPSAKRVVVQSTVNPEVLTGLRIQTADRQLDQTARGKLDRFEQSYKSGSEGTV